MILFIFSLPPAALGVYFAGAFVCDLARGEVVRAEIKGFQSRKDKGMRLPVVEFRGSGGAPVQAGAVRIDQMLYFFNRPGAGDFISILCLPGGKRRVRVHGYLYLVLAGFSCAPAVLLAGYAFGRGEAAIQALYALVFGGMILGGWALLKLIQRYY